jgi:enamine deaminase RidA (YjgF/YER057c/UK114 family)
VRHLGTGDSIIAMTPKGLRNEQAAFHQLGQMRTGRLRGNIGSERKFTRRPCRAIDQGPENLCACRISHQRGNACDIRFVIHISSFRETYTLRPIDNTVHTTVAHVRSKAERRKEKNEYTSDAVETPRGARWLFTAGTPGLAIAGTLPDGIAAQADLAWQHIMSLLARADMGVDDIVKVTQYLVHESDIADYARIRSRYLQDARPASMLLVVPALVRPGILVEIEIVAARA